VPNLAFVPLAVACDRFLYCPVFEREIDELTIAGRKCNAVAQIGQSLSLTELINAVSCRNAIGSDESMSESE